MKNKPVLLSILSVGCAFLILYLFITSSPGEPEDAENQPEAENSAELEYTSAEETVNTEVDELQAYQEFFTANNAMVRASLEDLQEHLPEYTYEDEDWMLEYEEITRELLNWSNTFQYREDVPEAYRSSHALYEEGLEDIQTGTALLTETLAFGDDSELVQAQTLFAEGTNQLDQAEENFAEMF